MYDAVFNDDVVKQAIAYRKLKVFLVDLCMQWAGSGAKGRGAASYCLPPPTPHCTPSFLKLSVGSGIEYLVLNPVRPIRTVHFINLTDRPADSATW